VRLFRPGATTQGSWLVVNGATAVAAARTLTVTFTAGTNATLTMSGIPGTSTVPGAGAADAALRVETAWLGLSAASPATSGNALFDNFTSSRF